jgi:hypothetical protein
MQKLADPGCEMRGSSHGYAVSRISSFASFFITMAMTLMIPKNASAVDAADAIIDAYDTSVFIVSPFKSRANGSADFKSTLPPFVQARRVAAEAKNRNRVMPVGMLTLHGTPCEGAEVLISAGDGRFLGSWPPARTRSARLKWLDLKLQKEPDGQLRTVEPDHWFSRLRGADALYAHTDSHRERGFVYDIEMPYTVSIELTADDEKNISILNHGAETVHDVTVFWPTKGTWRSGRLASVDSAAEDKDAKPVAVTFGDAAAATPQEAVALLKQPLTDLGLPAFHVERLLKTFAEYGVDKERMTVLFRLDDETIEELVPLEVFPAPRKQVRAAFVILSDMDPTLVLEIKKLVGQLGSDSWAEREAASERLKQMGNSCRSQLSEAAKSKDAEVAYRAENLLAFLPNLPAQKKKKEEEKKKEAEGAAKPTEAAEEDIFD